jgi:hypothetical protein
MGHRRLVPRFLAALDLNLLTDEDLHVLVGDIVTAAPDSPVVAASPALQASVAALGTKDAALVKASKDTNQDRQNLRNSIAVEAQARSDVHAEVRTYATGVTNLAKSPADLQTAGLKPRPPVPPRGTAPTVPENIVNKPPKHGHGKTIVSVEETGPTRHQFVAQQSLDGTTWAPLGVGHGKTRVVTGPSGTKVWVRFAMVRSGLQSDWSTAFLVTLP